MSHATDISSLGRLLAADFSNQAQSFENPPFFAHIRVCIRPLPIEVFTEPFLFLEQAYDFEINQPYRLRVFKLKIVDDHIEIENYKVKEEKDFFGAARDPGRLAKLTPDQLELMNGCDMNVEWTGHSFKGSIKPGRNCIVVRKEKTTYLDSQFDVSSEGMKTWDRGFDHETNEQIWGAIDGPFQFDRKAAFADEVAF
jgi:hypothetical protein